MSKDGKGKDKSKRRDSSKSGSSSESRKSRKSSSSTTITSSTLTPTTAFETLYPILNLPIPPVFTSDPYSAFSDLLDTLVMRYVPQLSGVLITHAPTRFLQDTAVFSADSAFATANVGFECVVWRPKIGQVLEGNIALSSPSHVSLLLYGLFNASIPASHLSAEWEFVNDHEAAGQGMGYWRSKVDSSKLGGQDGKLCFTVISLTVANHMLSLHGSLLDEPFNGPPPTLDKSYLKKTLLPSQALALATASPLSKTTADTPEAASSPTPTPRRVRWQDETDSSSDDDPSNFETPPSIVQADPATKDKSKRKSTTQTDEKASKREKKRRKEA